MAIDAASARFVYAGRRERERFLVDDSICRRLCAGYGLEPHLRQWRYDCAFDKRYRLLRRQNRKNKEREVAADLAAT